MCLLHSLFASIKESIHRSEGQYCIWIYNLQGLSMFTVSDDLVLYGGDKSGLAVCAMAGADWKWAAAAITGDISSSAVLTLKYIMLAQAAVCTCDIASCVTVCCCGQTACLH